MIKNRENRDLEDFKYLIDSRNLTDKDKREGKDAILKAREARFRERSDYEIKTAKLMQLKFQMEEYLNKPKYSFKPYFTKFLRMYIDTLYEKRKNFASDISVTPIALSHILNKHREPKDLFLYRLFLHSQDSFKNLCDFDKELWPKVYYQDKVGNFMTSSQKWKKSEEKFVKGKTVRVSE